MTSWNRRIPRSSKHIKQSNRLLRSATLRSSRVDAASLSNRNQPVIEAPAVESKTEGTFSPVLNAVENVSSTAIDRQSEGVKERRGGKQGSTETISEPYTPRLRVTAGRRRKKQRMTWEELEALDGLFMSSPGRHSREATIADSASQTESPSHLEWSSEKSAGWKGRAPSTRHKSFKRCSRPLLFQQDFVFQSYNEPREPSWYRPTRQSRFFPEESTSNRDSAERGPRSPGGATPAAVESPADDMPHSMAEDKAIGSREVCKEAVTDVDAFLAMGHTRNCWCCPCERRGQTGNPGLEEGEWTFLRSHERDRCLKLIAGHYGRNRPQGLDECKQDDASSTETWCVV